MVAMAFGSGGGMCLVFAHDLLPLQVTATSPWRVMMGRSQLRHPCTPEDLLERDLRSHYACVAS